MKILIYDTEIANAIPHRREPIIPNIHYAKGWDDYQGMGIACVSAYDYHAGQFRIFLEDNLNDLAALIDDSDLIVGFNNNRFDDDLMAVNGVVFDPEKTYDILQEIWEAAGHGKVLTRDGFNFKVHGGYSLDAVVHVNLNVRKNVAKSQQAPILWQQNKKGTVIDHALTDSVLTKRIFDQILETGSVIDPKTGKKLNLANPLERLSEPDPTP
jgi:hypothetical protein